MLQKRYAVVPAAAVLVLAGVAYALQVPPVFTSQESERTTTPAVPMVPAVQAVAPLEAYGVYSFGRNESMELAKKFSKAEEEKDRREIRKKLEELLEKEFDQQADRQEKELKALEEQIKSLRSMLRKRQEAKSAIIDRRIEELVNIAQGLGWSPDGTRPSLYRGGVFSTTPVPAGLPTAPASPRGGRASSSGGR